MIPYVSAELVRPGDVLRLIGTRYTVQPQEQVAIFGDDVADYLKTPPAPVTCQKCLKKLASG